VTRIDFYHYAEDKLKYACRLAATVAERDSRLVVFAR
jgi:DNA polymerase IIIc chi subunit